MDHRVPNTGVQARIDAHIDARHATYSQILDRLTLAPADRQNLRDRGLSDAEIGRRMYRSYSRNTFVALPNAYELARHVPGLIAGRDLRLGDSVKLATGDSGILIPVRRVGGNIAANQIRKHSPADPKKRYAWVSTPAVSSGTPIHVPLGIIGPCEVARITEGPLKADLAFVLSGTPTIGFAGVSCWHYVIPILHELGARIVIVSFDADARENIHVAEPLLKCVQGLLAEGFIVQLETWPVQWKGIDDLLKNGGTPSVERIDYGAMQSVEEIVKHARSKSKPQKTKPAKKKMVTVWRTKDKSEPPDVSQVSFLTQKNEFDLPNAITQVCGPPINPLDQDARRWRCPFCERITLRVWHDRRDTPRWKCVNSECGKGGDAPRFAKLVHNVGFREWCFRAGINPGNRGKREGAGPAGAEFAQNRICTNRGFGKIYLNPRSGSVFKAVPECRAHIREICTPCYRRWLRLNSSRFKLGVKEKQIARIFIYKCAISERKALLLRLRRLAKRAKCALFWVSVRNDAAARCIIAATVPTSHRKRPANPSRAARRLLWEAKFSDGWGKFAFSRNWPQPERQERQPAGCVEIADDTTHTVSLLRTFSRRRLHVEEFALDGAVGLQFVGLKGNQEPGSVDHDAIREEVEAIVKENIVREQYGDETGDAWGLQDDHEKGRATAMERVPLESLDLSGFEDLLK